MNVGYFVTYHRNHSFRKISIQLGLLRYPWRRRPSNGPAATVPSEAPRDFNMDDAMVKPLIAKPRIEPAGEEPCDNLSEPGQRVLKELLRSAIPIAQSNHSPFRKIWLEEAAYRAALLRELVTLRDQAVAGGAEWCLPLAHEIAVQFCDLTVLADDKLVLSRDCVARLGNDLLRLFCPGRDDCRLTFATGTAVMPAYRKRAVMLAAGLLILERLRHALQGGSGFDAKMILLADGLGFLHLRLGGAEASGVSPAGCQILASLAEIMHGELMLNRRNRREAYTEISFLPLA